MTILIYIVQSKANFLPFGGKIHWKTLPAPNK